VSHYYELVTAGQIPVSLDEIKCFLKVETELDDDLLTALLEAATQSAEKYTTRQLRANVWDLYINCFLARTEIRKDPVDSITSIRYLVGGTLQTVSSSVYYLKKNNVFDEILISDGQDWPSDLDDVEHGIVIRFVTEAHRCLPLAKQAIMRHVAFMYENRGDCDPSGAFDSITFSGAAALYDQFMIPRV